MLMGKLQGKRGFSLLEAILTLFIISASIELIFRIYKVVYTTNRIIKATWSIEDVAQVMSDTISQMPQTEAQYLDYLRSSFGTSLDPWGNHYKIAVANYDPDRLCESSYQSGFTVVYPDGTSVNNVLFVIWTHPIHSDSEPVFQVANSTITLRQGSIYNVYTLGIHRALTCYRR